jgi:hypothetical protein
MARAIRRLAKRGDVVMRIESKENLRRAEEQTFGFLRAVVGEAAGTSVP